MNRTVMHIDCFNKMRVICVVSVLSAAMIVLFLTKRTQADAQPGVQNICVGEPLKNVFGFQVWCHFLIPCKDGYYCVKNVCCPIDVPTKTPTIAEVACNKTLPNCPDGVVMNNKLDCPTCYVNPCISRTALKEKDGRATLCDPFTRNVCPTGYICTSTETHQGVCCLVADTLFNNDCPSVIDCDGAIVEGKNGCSVCLHHHTCIQIPCQDNEYCLVESSRVYNKVGFCVPQPCNNAAPHENEFGFTTLCTIDAQSCPNDYFCTPATEDSSKRHICCPSSSKLIAEKSNK